MATPDADNVKTPVTLNLEDNGEEQKETQRDDAREKFPVTQPPPFSQPLMQGGLPVTPSSDLASLLMMMQQQQQQAMQQQQHQMMQQQQQLIMAMEKQHKEEMRQHKEEMKGLMVLIDKKDQTTVTPPTSTPSFRAFDTTAELWKDYWARFQTFLIANSVPKERQPQVFLTNQSDATYKLISTLAAQMANPKQVNDLTVDEIKKIMDEQYDAKKFIVQERYKFWSGMQRKPGETIQELAARIRQDAAKCDFPAIKDALDEAMRTRFICAVGNEAVLKAVFKVKDDELTFTKAIEIAQTTEDAAKVAKETVYGAAKEPVYQVNDNQNIKGRAKKKKHPARKNNKEMSCYRCGKDNHHTDECRYKDSECNYCRKKGHIESACRQKKWKQKSHIRTITKEKKPRRVVKILRSTDRQPVNTSVYIKDKEYNFQVDTGSSDNFCNQALWRKLGKPKLQEPDFAYIGAGDEPLQVLGKFKQAVQADVKGKPTLIEFVVTKHPLNLLGLTALRRLKIQVDPLLHKTRDRTSTTEQVKAINIEQQDATALQKACQELCKEYSDLFKPELGCLEDFELEVKFKEDAKPVYCKPRTVPLALLDDLNQAYEAGIKKGIWIPTQFNEYGTPVVPVRKALVPGQKRANLRVCGDYSVTVNHQLEAHRHPIPLPDDLMRKLGGGYYFTKIDLADAYNQVKLSPESQRRLALSTHRGVLLQTRLPFGISSAPGYFQEIMDRLTCDLKGVAVYLDDILVSGANAKEHLENLQALLQRLQEKGLRCKLEKCHFAQPSVEYLGHTLSRQGVSKGPKVDAIVEMPPPTDISGVRSFLGATQFYAKFITNLSTMTEPLTRLTRKDTPWRWEAEQQAAFQRLKDELCRDTVLAHYDPDLEIGISCDASQVGIGVVLFHRYPDGSERPIANASKTLSLTQKKYSQIHREALAVIFGLKKFHHFLYGRKFILVTDHQPLVAMFKPSKGTPAMAANRLARWALTLSQYEYTVEYRSTKDHGNADALSRLPMGGDDIFDREEERADVNIVCNVRELSQQLNPLKPQLISQETSKDQILSRVQRYLKEGWPNTLKDELQQFKKLEDSLLTDSGCLFHGSRLVIPATLRPQVLDLLHLGHFGMQRMKQLARSVVYWPRIDNEIEELARSCTSCAEHQNKPPKSANHPWMLPEKPWSRLHLDHAINFMGSNWLVLVDAYSKYPCIHATSSTSTKATVDLLEQEFAHFGYPHTLVTDNATTFTSDEFQEWCKERGITHLSGAPYHPATNGAAERLVQSFKQSLRKSKLPPKAALQEFLMQYRRTPLQTGLSPSELLNGRQIRTKLDALVPSPAHVAQGKQAQQAVKDQQKEITTTVKTTMYQYRVGKPCYALYFGPKRNKSPRWVPAVVIKVHGTRSVNVRVLPRGPTWRRHIDQLRPRFGVDQDKDPGDDPAKTESNQYDQQREDSPRIQEQPVCDEQTKQPPRRRNWRQPNDNQYGAHNPRRSERLRIRRQ